MTCPECDRRARDDRQAANAVRTMVVGIVVLAVAIAVRLLVRR